MASRADSEIEAAPQVQTSASNVSPPLSPAAASTAESLRESYDVNEFVSEVPERLQCIGCGRIPREPQVTQCCSRVYCPACIRGQGAGEGEGGKPFIQVVRRTPCCTSKKEFSCKLDRTLQQQLQTLDVKCPNEDCTWSGTVNALLEEHSKTCVHAVVPCHDCARRMKRGDLNTHRSNECRFRETRCRHCSKVGTYAEIMALDSTTSKHKCPMILVACPNKCSGSKKIQRGVLPEHLAVCPLQSVDCSFKAVGCDAELTKKSFDRHMKCAQQQHLLLLLNAMQTKMTALSSEVDFFSKNVQDPTTLSSLACMKSHMRMGKLCLDGIGDEVTFRIRNYSHLERHSGNDGEWKSQSFYFLSNYRMELVAYPGGCGPFMGRSLSLSLIVHKPDGSCSNRDVGWPIDCLYTAIQISILQQSKTKHTQSDSETQEDAYNHKTTLANICPLCCERQDDSVIPEGQDQLDAVELVKDDDFVRSHVLGEAGLLLQDSIVLRVALTSCRCVP